MLNVHKSLMKALASVAKQIVPILKIPFETGMRVI